MPPLQLARVLGMTLLHSLLCPGHCRASDKCQREKRKTINGDDLLWAMSTLGFEDYVEPLKVYLAKFREVGDGGLQASLGLGGALPHLCRSSRLP